MMTETCPGCHSSNLTTEHLIKEYSDLSRASLDRMFGHNALDARDKVAALLLARGVTEIPNTFGPIPIRKQGD